MQAGDEAEDALHCLNEEGEAGVMGDYKSKGLFQGQDSLKGGGWSGTDVGCLGIVTSISHWHLPSLGAI